MKRKIEILYRNRAHFSGYMLRLIVRWHELFQDKNFKPEMMGHNSTVFIGRALEGLGYGND